MSHVEHTSLPSYSATFVLQDGCPTCEKRAESLEGLHHLDPERLTRLWVKMISREFDRYPVQMSKADDKACRLLYSVGVLLEHMTGENMKFTRPVLMFDPTFIKP